MACTCFGGSIGTLQSQDRPGLHKKTNNIWALTLWPFIITAIQGFCQAPEPVLLWPDSMPKSRAQIYKVESAEAVQAFSVSPEVVRRMVDQGIRAATGQPNERDAWRSLIQPEDKIGIKVHSAPGPLSGTRPAVAAAVVQGLLEAGISPTHIIVWDRNLRDLQAAGFGEFATKWGVRVAGSHQAGYDRDTRYENEILGKLVYGDLLFGSEDPAATRFSHVSNLIVHEMTKIINISPLLNSHNIGVAGHLWCLTSASVDNFRRFESNPSRLAVAVPEIYAMEAIGDRVLLSLTDALICQYQGNSTSLMHYSNSLNQLWFSRDPVALDVLSLRILSEQKEKAGVNNPPLGLELYENAALLELGVAHLRMIDLIPVE